MALVFHKTSLLTVLGMLFVRTYQPRSTKVDQYLFPMPS